MADGTTDRTTDRVHDLDDIIGQLAISDLQRAFVRMRCLDQISWLDGRARTSQRRYIRLKMVAIVGGVTVPTLVGLQLGNPTAQSGIQWLTLFLGLAVAIATAFEGFFKFGDRWRLYRRTAELLKTEVWQYVQLAGPYARHDGHAAAYTRFASRVETILGSDVEAYLSRVAAQPKAQAGAPPDQEQGG
jgi:hypothetical protein